MLNDLLQIRKDYTNRTISFEVAALKTARLQYSLNPVYRQYCDAIGVSIESIQSPDAIPYLPIQTFKYHRVAVSGAMPNAIKFGSSGTTGDTRSYHYVGDQDLYLQGAQSIFEQNYGSLDQYVVFGLLPSYLERTDSSLVNMVQHFIELSRGGGFYLNNYEELNTALKKVTGPIIVFGVTYALLDFAKVFDGDSSNLIIIETGGMKGRRAPMTKSRLHEILRNTFENASIHSEYGMTELCSQAYALEHGIFNENAMLKVRIREITDPFKVVKPGKSGIIQVTDLNNIYSCAFVETEDLGRKVTEQGFEILGRVDNSDARGCNLLVGD